MDILMLFIGLLAGFFIGYFGAFKMYTDTSAKWEVFMERAEELMKNIRELFVDVKNMFERTYSLSIKIDDVKIKAEEIRETLECVEKDIEDIIDLLNRKFKWTVRIESREAR